MLPVMADSQWTTAVLGRTGLRVGRLGIASSFRAPVAAYEEAFERGSNYFTWGTVLRGRCPHLRVALRNLIARGKRDQLVISLLSYAHNAWLTEAMHRSSLRQLGIDHADILLLGYHNRRPPQRLIDRTLCMKEQGLVRFIGITSHTRRLFPSLAREGIFDVFHLRYNAAHRGAEQEVFPALDPATGPGLVSFTATRWGRLLDPKKMPAGEEPPSAADCYRFVLSHPSVHVCMAGTRNLEQMRHALGVLEQGPMSEDQLARMRRIGDYVHDL
jgi:aryl-alcohol dehydrogenase-like predicted oxidoreductase